MEHIIIPDEKELYFVSDFHFYHHKLCTGYADAFSFPRNFQLTHQMNDAIVESLNKCGKDAVVVFLGDFMMNVPGSAMRDTFYELMDRIHVGQMLMIFGNHDHTLKKKLKNDSINFYPFAIIEHRGNTYFCQHRDFVENPYFLASEANQNLDFDHLYLVHGHTHSPIFLTKTQTGFIQNCVCFDVALRPINESELKMITSPCAGPIILNPVNHAYYEERAHNLGYESIEAAITAQISHAMNKEEVNEEITHYFNLAKQNK